MPIILGLTPQNASTLFPIVRDQAMAGGYGRWMARNTLPSSESFRYLGLWLSMDLDWSEQIHILNKLIAAQKWKTFTNKVDPAQLRVSYTEFLLPRLETGLLHANIPQGIVQCLDVLDYRDSM